MTLGFTLVWTASRMSRPARSMAVAVFQSSRSMLALLAAIMALMTRGTSPPASTCDSISAWLMFSPARIAWMREVDDDAGVDLPQPHADQVDQADLGARDQGLDVQADELRDHREEHQHRDQGDHDDCERDHGGPATVASFNLCEHHHEASPSKCIAVCQLGRLHHLCICLANNGHCLTQRYDFYLRAGGNDAQLGHRFEPFAVELAFADGRISVIAVPTWPSEKTGFGGADSAWFRMSRFPTGVCGQSAWPAKTGAGWRWRT